MTAESNQPLVAPPAFSFAPNDVPHDLIVPIEAYQEAEKARVQKTAELASGVMTTIFSAYAPPFVWGSWTQITSHIGVVRYEIYAEPISETSLSCKVNYYSANGWKEETFPGNTLYYFTTGNAVANIYVCFRGIIFGSAVSGQISP